MSLLSQILQGLRTAQQQQLIRAMDVQFGQYIADAVQLQGDDASQAWLVLLATSISHDLAAGHLCLPLAGINGESHIPAASRPYFAPWQRQLMTLLPPLTPAMLWAFDVLSDGSRATPLVLSHDRLYLHRYWHYQQQICGWLNQAQQRPVASLSIEAMQQQLAQLFARPYLAVFQAIQQCSNAVMRQQTLCQRLDIVQPEHLDWSAVDAVMANAKVETDLHVLDALVPSTVCRNDQQVAAAVALTQRFAVISGGPGTGKTTTVVKLLAALVMSAGEQARLNISLVAPTGKAAARLTESIGRALEHLALPTTVKNAIPRHASTIHRLLGAIPGRQQYRHHQGNPLHLDLLVVDEASMVDLAMMAKLMDALPSKARLILLGDRDQLASVEAGAVLGDIFQFSQLGYTQQGAKRLQQLCQCAPVAMQSGAQVPMADSLCLLSKSYRFSASSGIGQLARAINENDADSLANIWAQGRGDLNLQPLSNLAYAQLIAQVAQQYHPYLDAAKSHAEPREVLAQFAKVRLLCALREGGYGVQGLNVAIEQQLKRQQRIASQDEQWYIGRPVMISENDHAQGLYNGDIGIVCFDAAAQRLRVYFELPDGSMKGVLPSRLPAHETAYAMTVHKSQGSEFEHTLLLLPPKFSPILTRELVYTGVTRAKERLTLFAEQAIVLQAMRQRTERRSGLYVALASSD